MKNPTKKVKINQDSSSVNSLEKKKYRPFSETEVQAYISDVRKSSKGYYFVDLSLKYGKDDNGDNIYQYVSLLVSKSLEYLAQKIIDKEVIIEGVSWNVQIYNLIFYVSSEKDNEGDNYLSNQGILNSIKI